MVTRWYPVVTLWNSDKTYLTINKTYFNSLKVMSAHFMTGENTDFHSSKLKTALGWQNFSTNSYMPGYL